MNPKIGVVVVNYNQMQFITDALNSIKEQVYDGEIHTRIVDDCSTDKGQQEGLKALVDYWVEEDGFKNLGLILQKKNKGPNAARNAGTADLKDCEYIVCLDADDMLEKHYIRTLAEKLEETKADVAYPSFEMFGVRRGFTMAMPFHELHVRAENCLVSPSMHRRKLWEKVKGWDESREMISGEDWSFWLDCIQAGAIFIPCPEAVLFYRQKPESRNRCKAELWKKSLDYFREKYGDWFLR